MKKKDYRQEIHAIFEQMRTEIPIRSELSILRLEILEKREQYALEQNSRETIKKNKQSLSYLQNSIYFYHTT